MKKYILSAFLFLITYSSFSQSSNWKLIDVEKTNITDTSLKLRKTVPTNFEVYKLETQKLKNKISFTKANEVIFIELPTPDGIQKFSIKKASSLSFELTEKFPMIVAYVGKGIDNPSAVARISFGTDGFHGVIFYGDKPSFYIDPYTKNNDYYIAYTRSSLPQRDQEFRCGVNTQLKSNKVIENTQKNANDGLLRTYRLALVCSGEYAEFHLNDQGVANNASDNIKKAAVLSAMNTSMTRINGVFERDLGVRMEIVGNNDQIIFLDAASDGITDGSAGTMINQVQTICDNTIGNANYDIGHIFSIGGSGLAGLGVVCLNGQKARGVTGIGTPTGDPYDIDYVSHEMGHQFGANHTQNNGCNRNNSTAVEPGSASTIMGYAGICAPNVQNNSDDHFHSVSISEMWNKIQSTANCAATTSTGNSAPIINDGQDYSIPKSTPFVLKGNASDVNQDDVLSYNWEQTDNQVATMPPVSTSTSGPAFRSNSSMSSPNRYMPALTTVIAGSISSTWEVVPTVAREMNFSLVVRDNAAGGGNSARDNIKVTTENITPFTVDGPSTNVDWAAGSTQTINWVIGATNQTPVNSQNMNILLSTDGGISFPITLASGTANDGTQTIVVPNNITTQARILVEAADNIFYNVNATNFTISASGQTYNWTGVADTSWNNTSNWSTGVVPTSSDDVVVAGIFNNEPAIATSTDAFAKTVTIASGNSLTVDQSSSLTVSGDFTNDGSVTLNSTADDFSSLIVEGTASGNITYNRYVNIYDDANGGGWDLVGSPTVMTITDFIAANGANIQVLGDDYAFSQYNNLLDQWERYATDTDTGDFTTAQGYSMATASDGPLPPGGAIGTTVAFTGAMQTTSQSINIINNNGLNGVGRRWNLVSNPFPSYINGNTAAGATNFIDANTAVIDGNFGAVYGWNGSSYTIYNLLDGAFSIAPGQGFWVAALNTIDTSLNFTAAMRTTTGTGDFVLGPQPLTYHIALKLYNGESQKAMTNFYFRDGLSLDLDPWYDAGAYNQSTKLSTRLPGGSNQTAFARNAMGMEAMQNTRVPLEIRQNAGQAFTISVADMDLPQDIYVYLEDTLNGTLTSLKEGDFELTALSDLSGVDRFFIVFKSNSVLSSGDTLGINALNVYKASNDDFVTIAGITPDLGKLDVRLYSVLGQTVRKKVLNPTAPRQTLSTQGLASGLYIIQIKSGNQTTVKKVIIK